MAGDWFSCQSVFNARMRIRVQIFSIQAKIGKARCRGVSLSLTLGRQSHEDSWGSLANTIKLMSSRFSDRLRLKMEAKKSLQKQPYTNVWFTHLDPCMHTFTPPNTYTNTQPLHPLSYAPVAKIGQAQCFILGVSVLGRLSEENCYFKTSLNIVHGKKKWISKIKIKFKKGRNG